MRESRAFRGLLFCCFDRQTSFVTRIIDLIWLLLHDAFDPTMTGRRRGSRHALHLPKNRAMSA